MILIKQQYKTDVEIINFRYSYARALREYKILKQLDEGGVLTNKTEHYYCDLRNWLNKYLDKYIEITGSILG